MFADCAECFGTKIEFCTAVAPKNPGKKIQYIGTEKDYKSHRNIKIKITNTTYILRYSRKGLAQQPKDISDDDYCPKNKFYSNVSNL